MRGHDSDLMKGPCNVAQSAQSSHPLVCEHILDPRYEGGPSINLRT